MCLTPLLVASVLAAVLVAGLHPDGLPFNVDYVEPRGLGFGQTSVIPPLDATRSVIVCVAAVVTIAAMGALLARCWKKRHSLRETEQPREWVVLAAVAVGAFSCGTFTGSLNDVRHGLHLTGASVYFVFAPVALLALGLTSPVVRAVPRVVAFAGTLYGAATLSYGYAQYGEFRWWDDPLPATVVIGAGAVLVAIISAWARAMWFRRPPFDPDNPLAPRRPHRV